MKRHAKAPSAGYTDGSGKTRCLVALLGGLALLGSLALGVSLSAAAAPTLTIEPASEIGFTTAKAEGEVKPEGKDTSFHFEYISDAQFKENENVNGLPGFAGAAEVGFGGPITVDTPVDAPLEGLVANTTYHLRLLATNEDGTEVSVAPNFTTQAATPPILALDSPSEVKYTTAHISGSIDPEGGNVNPLGGPVGIGWQLEINREGAGWEFAEAGAISNEEPEGGGPIPAESTDPIPVSKDLEFLVPGSKYKFRLKAFYAGLETTKVGGEFETEAVSAPLVLANDASAVGGTRALFSGTVSAGGTDAAFNSGCRFDYVTDRQFLIDEFASAPQIECDLNPVTGTGSPEVAAEPTDLEPNTVYHLRLWAENLGGQSTSVAPNTFTTEAIAPTIVDAFATDVSRSSATLSAKIRPGGIPTTYHFEYLTLSQFKANGETFAGAFQTPESVSIGEDNAVHPVSANLSELQPGTPYRFRVVATNAQSDQGQTPGSVVSFNTGTVPVAQGCPNEQLRTENRSLELPDCRAYELVSFDSNHSIVAGGLGSRVAANGEAIIYVLIDAPENAESGAAAVNFVRAKRDPVNGWRGVSLAPPLVGPVTGYQSFSTSGISSDFSASVVVSNQNLGSGPEPNGYKLFASRPNGAWHLLTPVAGGSLSSISFVGGNADFSRVYFQAPPQRSGDPAGNTYSWSEEDGLKLVGILKDGTPAQNGAGLVGRIIGAFSADTERVVFLADGILNLRTDESQTVELGPVRSDPGTPANGDQAGITTDGQKVIFTSLAELTPDANTGGESGRNLYTYDTETEEFTDLTVDSDPGGAGVMNVLGATPSGSHIYFTATGDLADGAVPGHPSLYVWHNDKIDFVADATGFNYIVPGSGGIPPLYVTPNGQHVAFESTQSLTGYDNRDPVSGEAHTEVFEATIGGDLKCASCRPDGTRPRSDSAIPFGGARGTLMSVSEDGRRVFFQSTDAVIPQAASNQLQKVFEYGDGKVSLLSPAEGSSDAVMQGASLSGDDVFFSTYDELTPNLNGGDSAVYDARVNGGFATGLRQGCSGNDCRGQQEPAPEFNQPASRSSDSGGGQNGKKKCRKGRIRRHGQCVKRPGHRERQKRRGNVRQGSGK